MRKNFHLSRTEKTWRKSVMDMVSAHGKEYSFLQDPKIIKFVVKNIEKYGHNTKDYYNFCQKLISQGFDPVHLRTYIVYLETIWCIKLKYDYDKFQERDDVYRTFSFDSYKFMYDLYYKPSVVLRRRFGKTKLIYS